MSSINKNRGKGLANSAIDFSEDERYHGQPSEENKERLEFLEAISQMLIYYKSKEEKDHV